MTASTTATTATTSSTATTATAQYRVRAIRIGKRTTVSLTLVSAIGIVAFGWPLFAGAGSSAAQHAAAAPWLFALLLPLVLGVVLAQVADGGMDAKAVAMLGVLAAIGTALRPLGTGIAGFEPVFIVLILGGRALGPGFGFALGTITMLSSAALTGGVGTWLPFQMIAAGWFGFGAGCLPGRTGGRIELFILAAYGAVASLIYGLLLNLSFWPWATGLPEKLAYLPGAEIIDNLRRWILFDITTSLGFDIPRAIFTALLVFLVGKPVLHSLRRATRRAAFGAAVSFAAPSPESFAAPKPNHIAVGDDD